MKKLFKYLLDFTFPEICLTCNEVLVSGEEYLCTHCLNSLPRITFHDDPKNEVEQIFWGRVYLTSATAYCRFIKGGKLQEIIHHMKYRSMPGLGKYLGKHFGAELLHTRFAEVDLILPVPLHHRKLKKRGFNQSLFIAEGIAEIMKKPLLVNTLVRIVHRETQTKKGRYERWENIRGSFRVNDNESLKYKHILLVDDILTTGATLEACADVILTIDGTRVSIATLGLA